MLLHADGKKLFLNCANTRLLYYVLGRHGFDGIGHTAAHSKTNPIALYYHEYFPRSNEILHFFAVFSSSFLPQSIFLLFSRIFRCFSSPNKWNDALCIRKPSELIVKLPCTGKFECELWNAAEKQSTGGEHIRRIAFQVCFKPI